MPTLVYFYIFDHFFTFCLPTIMLSRIGSGMLSSPCRSLYPRPPIAAVSLNRLTKSVDETHFVAGTYHPGLYSSSSLHQGLCWSDSRLETGLVEQTCYRNCVNYRFYSDVPCGCPEARLLLQLKCMRTPSPFQLFLLARKKHLDMKIRVWRAFAISVFNEGYDFLLRITIIIFPGYVSHPPRN